MKTEVVIIGAGVIGLAIAKSLSEAGKEVMIIDQDGFGTKASGTNLGQLSISDRDYALEYNLVMESLDIYAQTQNRRNLEYKKTGGIFPIETQEDLKIAMELVRQKQKLGYNIELLLGEGIKEVEPKIEDILGAIYCPDEGRVNPFLVNSWLMDEAIENGIEVLLYHKVKDFRIEKNIIKGVVLEDRVMEADTIILATGAWSKDLMANIGIELEIDYIRGSALVTQPFPKIIRGPVADGCYFNGNIPEDQFVFFGGVQQENGTVIVSQASRNVSDYDTSLDFFDMSDMAQLFLKHFPVLEDALVVRAWSGVTTTTPDAKPYWGYTNKYKNLFLAIAFKGAFSLAPAVGQYTAQWVVDGDIEEEKKIWTPILRNI